LTNTLGTVQVDSGGTLDLQSAIVAAGTLTNSGPVNSTGTSALNSVTITNNTVVLFEVTSGELVINLGSVTNTGTIEVVGGTLDLESLTVTNFVAANNGTLKVDSGATLDLESAIITGGTVINHGLLQATGGAASTIEN